MLQEHKRVRRRRSPGPALEKYKGYTKLDLTAITMSLYHCQQVMYINHVYLGDVIYLRDCLTLGTAIVIIWNYLKLETDKVIIFNVIVITPGTIQTETFPKEGSRY